MRTITKLLTIPILTLSFLFTQCTSKGSTKEQANGTEENSKSDSELKAASEGLNKMCPADFGEGIRLDKTEVLANNTFALHCSVLDDYATRLDEEDMESFKVEMKKAYIQTCRTKEWSFIKRGAVNLFVTFKDKNGREFSQLQITPEDYK